MSGSAGRRRLLSCWSRLRPRRRRSPRRSGSRTSPRPPAYRSCSISTRPPTSTWSRRWPADSPCSTTTATACPTSSSRTARRCRRSGSRSPADWNRLFHNNGGFQFTDVTESAGVQGVGYTTGAAAGDFDNDGHVDLFVAGVQRNQLLRNTRRRHASRTSRRRPASRTTRGRSRPAGSITTTTAGSTSSSSTTWTGRRRRNKFCGDRATDLRVYCHPEALPRPGQRALPQPSRRDVRGCLGEVGHRRSTSARA